MTFSGLIFELKKIIGGIEKFQSLTSVSVYEKELQKHGYINSNYLGIICIN